MNLLSEKILSNMCKEYHLIDKNIYNKDLYQKELIYRLSYSIICNYIPKDSIYNSTFLLLYNQDIQHCIHILNIVKELIRNNDYNIDGFKINLILALEKYNNNIQIITTEIQNKINILNKNLMNNKTYLIDYTLQNQLYANKNIKNLITKFESEMYNNNDEYNNIFNELFNKFMMNLNIYNAELDAFNTFTIIQNEYKNNINFTIYEHFDYYYYYYYNNIFNDINYDIYYEENLCLLLNEYIDNY